MTTNHLAPSKDSDQTMRTRKLISVYFMVLSWNCSFVITQLDSYTHAGGYFHYRLIQYALQYAYGIMAPFYRTSNYMFFGCTFSILNIRNHQVFWREWTNDPFAVNGIRK